MALSYFLLLIYKKLCETFHILDKIECIGMYIRITKDIIIYYHIFKMSENPDILFVFIQNKSDFHVIKCFLD